MYYATGCSDIVREEVVIDLLRCNLHLPKLRLDLCNYQP